MRRILTIASDWHIGQVVVVWALSALVVAGCLYYRRDAADAVHASWSDYGEAREYRSHTQDAELRKAAGGYAGRTELRDCDPRKKACLLTATTGIPLVITRAHGTYIERQLERDDVSAFGLLQSDSTIRTRFAAIADSAVTDWRRRRVEATRLSGDDAKWASERWVRLSVRARRVRFATTAGIGLAVAFALLTLWSWSAARARAS